MHQTHEPAKPRPPRWPWLTPRDRGALWRLGILLALIPLLPDRTFGPYAVLNPRQVGWMVVLVVGVNLFGYLMLRLFGARAGLLLAGVIGGLISSTAVALAYSRTTRTVPGVEQAAALGITLATAVSLLRVPFELAVVARPSLLQLWLPSTLLFLATLIGPAWLARQPASNRVPNASENPAAVPRAAIENARPLPRTAENPAQLGVALLFGMLYAGVLLASAAAKRHLGESGLYGLAAVSGFTDLDAITLSTGRLLTEGRLELATGYRAVVVAVLANQVFKLALILVFANALARRLLLIAFAPTMLACLALIAVDWPL